MTTSNKKAGRQEAPKAFDKALEKLEGIVAQLETGDLSLEKSLELFEQGVRLASQLDQRLGDAEMKVEMLLESTQGTHSVPFDPPEDDAP
ncbi:MAG: exodeoxyribonuclease VII small subunit [Acidobacteriota bacterium]|nr:exodeoxyribonuclease VII small subunit [Acidobacteriota bacterium]